jgi:hypothetical protein
MLHISFHTLFYNKYEMGLNIEQRIQQKGENSKNKVTTKTTAEMYTSTDRSVAL